MKWGLKRMDFKGLWEVIKAKTVRLYKKARKAKKAARVQE